MMDAWLPLKIRDTQRDSKLFNQEWEIEAVGRAV